MLADYDAEMCPRIINHIRKGQVSCLDAQSTRTLWQQRCHELLVKLAQLVTSRRMLLTIETCSLLKMLQHSFSWCLFQTT